MANSDRCLVGVHRGDHFVYVGRVGTRYGAKKVETLLPKLKAMEADKSPFTGVGEPKKEKKVVWLKPELVAEIEFAGWSADPASTRARRRINSSARSFEKRAVAHLRSARRQIRDHLLKHVSPLSWEHINLNGIYSWNTEHQMPEGFRPGRFCSGAAGG